MLFGNSMGDGQAHSSQHLPFIIAGSCGKYFKTGQCAASAGQPVTAALASLAEAMGVAPGGFGAPLPALRA